MNDALAKQNTPLVGVFCLASGCVDEAATGLTKRALLAWTRERGTEARRAKDDWIAERRDGHNPALSAKTD